MMMTGNLSKGRYLFFLILFSFLFRIPDVSGQGSRVLPLEKEAAGYFQEKAYARALEDYNKLLEVYPRDPGYNYHAGVCMTELGQEPEKAIYRLKIASLKQVPADVFFYLGKACYQAGRYDEAIGWYERFSQKVSSAERKDYHVEKFITDARLAQEQVARGHNVSPREERSPRERASVTALAYRHRADSLEQVIAAEKKELATTGDPADREHLQRRITDQERLLAGYREQAGIWAVRAGEGEKENSNDYTLFGPGDQTTRVLAPVSPVSEEEAAPFLELAGEDYYKNPGMQKIISGEDVATLDSYREMTRKGNDFMKEAWKKEQEAARQQMIINTSSSSRERSRAESRIKSLEEEKEAKRLQALKYFRQANDGEYALNRKYLVSLMQMESVPEVRRKQAGRFNKEAERNYGRALQLREAANRQPQGRKYDKLMEANAYELMALDNQRKAITTLAGLMPATEKDMSHVAVAARKPTPSSAKKEESNKKVPAASGDGEEKVYRPGEKKVTASHIEELSAYPYGLVMRTDEPYSSATEIPSGEKMAGGVNYRLQVGVFGKDPDMSYFRGMYPLFREEVPGKDLTRYYAGQFRTYGEAAQALLKVREMGYKDAIVVGFYNVKRSHGSRIRPLEDEHSYTNLLPATQVTAQPQAKEKEKVKTGAREVSGQTVKTAPGKQLVYRVQVGVFRKPLSPEKLNALEEIAGMDHVVIRTKNNQNYFIYAIGNFTTFEEAKQFRNKLAERGMSGCFVTAYRNGARILIGEEGTGK